ncbi:MAG TPA: LysM peptidoglycan-binding domain-containing protein [Campylobacterales bacterium]|nr:LysM peptidoglycan-binding domain-containing protein [Campylobacterales bacterium]
MDTLDEQNVNISNINNANYQQEIDNQNSKKVDNFNKVIIEKNAEVSQDDLSKLYNQLNTIMKKDKKKTKTSKYTKMISKEVKTRENAMRIITVKSGDSLSKLAFKAYGETSMFYKIFEANPDIVKDPDKIYIGQRLRVPR